MRNRVTTSAAVTLLAALTIALPLAACGGQGRNAATDEPAAADAAPSAAALATVELTVGGMT